MPRLLRYVTFAATFALCTIMAYSEQPILLFEHQTFNFGDVSRRGGATTCHFPFVNNSDSSIVILGAAATCGCSIPEYPRYEIAPNATDTVSVTFDPVGQPDGQFSKKITIRLKPVATQQQPCDSIKPTCIASTPITTLQLTIEGVIKP